MKSHLKKYEFLYIAIIIVATIVVYSPSFSNSFVWDDSLMIKSNPALRAPSIQWLLGHQFLPKTFSQNTSIYYRPVSLLWFWLGYRIWGLAPLGYRIENLFLYLLVVLLFYYIVRKTAGVTSAIIAAMIFAFHPVHIENVAFPSGITDVSAGLFMLLAFSAYLSKKWGLRYILSPLFWGLALLSKETAAMGIVAIVAYDIIFRRDGVKRILTGWFEWLLVMTGYFAMRYGAIGNIAQSAPAKYSIFNRMLFSAYFLIRYIQNIIFPIDLRPYHPESIESIGIFSAIVSWLAVLSIVYFAVRFLRRRGKILFGALWFVIFLLPVLGIVYVSAASWAERFLFVSSMGFAFSASIAVEKFIRSKPAFAPKLPKILIASYIIYLASVSFIYSFYWRNDWMLFRHIITKSPSLALGYTGVARLFLELEQVDSAEVYAQKAMEKDSTYFPAMNIAAKIWLIRGNIDSTKYYLEKAIEKYPEYSLGYLNMGKCILEEGDTILGVKYFKKAFTLAPRDMDANLNYGIGLVVIGDTLDGIEFLRRACRYYPEGIHAPLELANVYISMGDTVKAKEVIQKFPQIRKFFKKD